MGILDVFKKEKKPASHIRWVHVMVETRTDEGLKREKILADIFKKKPPFDKQLNIGIEEYEWEGKPDYYVIVNGINIGPIEREMYAPLLTDKERIKEISNFKVTEWEEDYYERKHYDAKLMVTVENKKRWG